VVELGLWRDYTQTKRKHYHPWCEDGTYALGLGVLAPHTMVREPKPLHAMVAAKNKNNLFANRIFGPGMNVRYCTISSKQINSP
jgi:hypothetical protein